MLSRRKTVRIGDATLILGDCRDVLPRIADEIDAVVTDPPYGVSLQGKRGHYRNRPRAFRPGRYPDGMEEFESVVLPTIAICREMAKACLVFMADCNIFRLPPGNIGGIFLPNGCGMGRWGFQCFMLCVLYGKDPYLANRMGSRPNGKSGLYGNDANRISHPCAKPIAAMEWAVNRASLSGDLVLDPFMGSGTTGVACATLGRRFIGIEIEPKWFDIACERIEAAYRLTCAQRGVDRSACQAANDRDPQRPKKKGSSSIRTPGNGLSAPLTR
jgi:site-specific DNA-methyltransferase (adenine-specific)/modification methylase